jgi:hypothetical protein
MDPKLSIIDAIKTTKAALRRLAVTVFFSLPQENTVSSGPHIEFNYLRYSK